MLLNDIEYSKMQQLFIDSYIDDDMQKQYLEDLQDEIEEFEQQVELYWATMDALDEGWLVD